MDTVREFSNAMQGFADKPRTVKALVAEMLWAIAHDLNPKRPGRSEPRAKKRRPKSYKFLTAGAELKVAWLDRFESGGSSRGGRSGVGFLLKLPNIYSSSSGSEGAAGRRAGWWAVVGGRWSVVGGRWGGRGLVRVWRRGTVFGDRLAG